MSATNRGGTRDKLDRYYTPDDCAEALCGVLPLQPGQSAIEPSVGAGAFARALTKRGLLVAGYDLDPGAPGLGDCTVAQVADWLTVGQRAENGNRLHADWIIGNPPYREAEAHIRHALGLGDNVAMLLRIGFLEALKRRPFWTEHPLHRLWVLSPRPSFTGGGNDATAYAWFWWKKGAADARITTLYWKGGSETPTEKTVSKPTGRALSNTRGVSMHITEIASNVKGAKGAVELGEKTLFLGPCKSGKSRLVNVIELALTGRVSDLAGKDRSVPADLLALAPGREGALWARATLSDGSVCSWETESSGPGSAKTPEHNLPAGVDKVTVLPLRALQEAISGKPDKARRFFLGAATGLVTVQDVLDRMPAGVLDSFGAMVTDEGAFVRDPTGTLLAVRDLAHRKHLDAKGRAKTLATTLTILQATSAIRPTEAQLLGAREALAAAETTREAAVRADAQADSMDIARAGQLAREKLPALEAAVAQSDKALRTLNEQLQNAQVDPATSDKAMRGAALLMLADWQLGKAGGAMSCPCALCGVSAQVDQLGAQRDRIHAAVQAVTEASADTLQQQAAIANAIMEWKTYRDTHADRIPDLRYAVERADRTVAHLGQPSDDLPSVAEARELCAVALGKVTSMQRAFDSWDSVSRIRTDAQEAEEERDEAARLRDACQTAADELLAASLEEFAAKVQKYLPDTDTFAMRLHEGKREVFQLGLLRAGVIHTALSGAEWAEVTAAVAAALADGNALTVIIPEERAMDPKTLRAVMTALTKAPGQVVLTSVVKPFRGTPAGWTVVDVEKLQTPPGDAATAPDAQPSNGGGAPLSL
jgi:hypothetical protein